MEDTRRVAVLLGAGASRDAGLPLTSELAEVVLQRLSGSVSGGDRRPDWLDALNFTYGAMVSHRSRDGSNPLDAVNIETLISALRLLKRPESHEAAPFVESWREPTLRSGFARADTHTSHRLVENLNVALGLAGGNSRDARQAAINVGYYIAEIAEFARTPTRGSAFSEADRRVTEILGSILVPSRSVAYLYPLADLALRQQGGLDILTLNYDLAVETAMSERSIAVDRGLRDWPEHRVTYQTRSPLRLHKMHGSLDWSLELDGRGLARLHDLDGTIAEHPWIVVGDREKLATDGPTLELVQHAADALERADHLVVAGYGFADDYVNQMIRNWLERDDARTIGLIEPHSTMPDQGTFRASLSALYGERRGPDPGTSLLSRIQGFDGTAAALLEEALAHPGVTAESNPSLEVGPVKHGEFESIISITLRGSSLNQVHFSSWAGRADVEVHADPTRLSYGPDGTLHYLSKWFRDEELRVRLKLHSWTADPITVSVNGRTLASSVVRSFEIDSGYHAP